MATPKQIQYVRGLLRKTGQEDEKDALVSEYTDGRTTHLSEMTHQETQVLIKALGGGKVTPKDKMVRKVLSMAHEMQWEKAVTASGSFSNPAKREVDMVRVNAWTNKHFHKDLDKISEEELPKVVTAFTSMYNDFLNRF